MVLPGKKERVWNDPPMPGEETQVPVAVDGNPNATIGASSLEQLVEQHAYAQIKSNLYLVVAFYALFYSVFWYALMKYIIPGAPVEDVLMASLIIPAINAMMWLMVRTSSK